MEEDLQQNALNSLGDINQRILYLLKEENDNIISEVKEAIYEWLSTLVQIVHENFSIMDEVIEFVFKSADLDDMIIDDGEEDNENELMKQDDDEAKYKGMNIRTNCLDEKAAALHLMGVFAEYLPLPFGSYRKRLVSLLKDNCNG